ncbi:MAG: KGGVGR-motif variant AAA ATPase, partial [Lachnospiraceae bacterium]
MYMPTFDQTLKKATDIIEKWNFSGKLQEVTIIRDVFGCLTFLIDSDNAVSQQETDQLKQTLQNQLGQYFKNNVYLKKAANNDLVQTMIGEIERLRVGYEITAGSNVKNGVKWYILERAIAKKAWIECRNTENAVWPYEEAQKGKMPKVITFYSFKGGMGRTTALAAVALALAQQGKNVLAIDTDIEAPGLASLFFDDGDIQEGTVDYLLEAAVSGKNPVNMMNMIHQVTDQTLMENISGNIFIIPAGAVDSRYLQKLARIDYQDAVPNNMKTLISRMTKDAVQTIGSVSSVDYILFDSRAGFHDMGGVVTAQIPHGVILFGKNSRQSWQGLELVLKTIGNSQKEIPSVAIVDSSCGNQGNVTEKEMDSFREQAYTICCDNYYPAADQPGVKAENEVHSPIFIPYNYLLTDNVQLFTDGSQEKYETVKRLKQILLGESYQKIRSRIQLWFDDEGGKQADE